MPQPSNNPSNAPASGAPPLPSAPVPIGPPSSSLASPSIPFPTAPALRVKRKGAVGDVQDNAKKARPGAGERYLNPFPKAPPTPSTLAAPKEPPIDPQLLREHLAAHAPIFPAQSDDLQGLQNTALEGGRPSQPPFGPPTTSLERRVPTVGGAQVAFSNLPPTPHHPRASAAPPPLPSRAPTPSRNTSSMPAVPVAVTVMPKAVRDKLSVIEDRMDHLESTRASFAPVAELATLRTRVTALEKAHQQAVENARLELNNLHAAHSALATTVDTQTQELAALRQRTLDEVTQRRQPEDREDTRLIKTEAAAVKVKSERSQTKDEKEKNNLFNAAMRSAFLSAMAMPAGTKNKNLALPIPVDGGGWVARSIEHAAGSTVDVVEMSQVLRPDWGKPWGGNSGWQDRLVEFARTKVPQIQPAITAEFMAQKSDADLDSRMKTVFKAMRQCWQTNQLQSADSDAPPAKGPARTAAEQTLISKRKSRKTRKSLKRREALADPVRYDPASTQGWLWLVQDPYMSTDESSDEIAPDAIDPTSDDESVKKQGVNRIAPWITRPPKYRGSAVTAFIDMLDKAVATRAASIGKVSHPRIKGECKDTALPRFSDKDAAFRIPRWAVDPAWLAAHPKEEAAISSVTPPSISHITGSSTEGCMGMGDDALGEMCMSDRDEGDAEWELQSTAADG